MKDRFTFFRSYWEAITGLPEKKQLVILRAICDYALDGTAPNLTGIERSIFLLIQPTLDLSERRASYGKTGGKQSASKGEAN